MRPSTYEIKPLQGSQNYKEWKMTMEHILLVDGLPKVVKGTDVKPTDSSSKFKDDALLDEIKWYRK